MGAPEGIRTPNLLIRSQMLYPLSYGRMAEWPRQLYWTASEASESAVSAEATEAGEPVRSANCAPGTRSEQDLDVISLTCQVALRRV